MSKHNKTSSNNKTTQPAKKARPHPLKSAMKQQKRTTPLTVTFSDEHQLPSTPTQSDQSTSSMVSLRRLPLFVLLKPNCHNDDSIYQINIKTFSERHEASLFSLIQPLYPNTKSASINHNNVTYHLESFPAFSLDIWSAPSKNTPIHLVTDETNRENVDLGMEYIYMRTSTHPVNNTYSVYIDTKNNEIKLIPYYPSTIPHDYEKKMEPDTASNFWIQKAASYDPRAVEILPPSEQAISASNLLKLLDVAVQQLHVLQTAEDSAKKTGGCQIS